MSRRTIARLRDERKAWRKNPVFGFVARPSRNEDGTLNLKNWECSIPGKKGTPWEGGRYKLRILFDDGYPTSPPRCIFQPPIFHVNINVNGIVCSSMLNRTQGWHKDITVKEILLGIQQLLNEPNPLDPARPDACLIYQRSRLDYENLIRDQARSMIHQDLHRF